MTTFTKVQIYLRNFNQHTQAVRDMLEKVDPGLLELYFQGPAKLQVLEHAPISASEMPILRVGFWLCQGPLSSDDRDALKQVPTVVVFPDSQVDFAREALEAGAIDCLCMSELLDSRVAVPCLCYAARAQALERQMSALSQSARHVAQLEHEAFARFALLPASSLTELFALLSGLLDERRTSQGQHALRIVAGAVSRLLPPGEKGRHEVAIARDVSALAGLLVEVLRVRGLEASCTLDIEDEGLKESQHAECHEFLVHAAILAILSARDGMKIDLHLYARASGVRLDFVAPASLFSPQALDRQSVLKEPFGSLLRISVDASQVRITLSSSAATPETGALTILIVDDNHVNALLLERLIAKQGHRPVKFLNSLEAFESCKSTRYDAIITDIHMPDMDGICLTQRLRKELRVDTPIFAFTADHSADLRDRCLEAGISDVVLKPFTPAALRKVVETVLEMMGASPRADSKITLS